ncbi:ABC transporter ATP-binding protein [Streptomyces sp. NPDC127098]|uniref:ABC transporter ATP-binding protein n=1 Tax=Streptomyces sp. NPDC127098 TaxID=3347137 RepID=UPI00365A9AF1
MNPAAATLDSVTKTYDGGGHPVAVLDDVTLAFPRGGFTAIMGPSGSGKSTLLHCAAGLDRPTRGTVRIDDVDLTELDEAQLTSLRRELVGFVFQSYNLLPSLTVADNITLPLRLADRPIDPDHLRETAAHVGLADRLQLRPARLSGGQQQRVAIARALITRPAVVFADEPTGALDLRTGRRVLDLLRDSVERLGQTVVMVTHDPAAAARADEVLFLADGRLRHRMPAPTTERVASVMTRLEA